MSGASIQLLSVWLVFRLIQFQLACTLIAAHSPRITGNGRKTMDMPLPGGEDH